jgi:chromate transporter
MVTVPRLGWYFLRLGTMGFGGPIALAGAMQRALVEERGWISRDEYVEGLAIAQLAPGPLAAQLAMYLGYIRGGIVGATVCGAAFILPSFLMVWALAAAYVRLGGLAWMQALFYGIGAAVVGIIARSVLKLAGLTLARDRVLWSIAAVLMATTAITARENVWLFLLSGILVTFQQGRSLRGQIGIRPLSDPTPTPVRPLSDRDPTPVRPLSDRDPTPAAVSSISLVSIAWFFTRAGAFVFGSGLAIVPFLYGGVVQERHWLTDRQFLDAVAVAMITPGPVVITVGFIGYLVRGTAGMVVAALAVFLPVYLMVVIAAPWFRRYHARPDVKAFVRGVTAAATGAIAGAAVLLGARAIVDPWTAAIALATFVVLWRWRISELWLIAAAGGLGVCLR